MSYRAIYAYAWDIAEEGVTSFLAQFFNVLKRATSKKNSKFVVNKRDAVALIASGSRLPDWSPPPQI
jgi:hypothetical protein